MAKQIDFSSLKIGDLVLTTNNKIGEVIALKSYAYLNDKIAKRANPDKVDFIADNNRHNGVWYSAITVMIEDDSSETPKYYTEGLDFIEIREILTKENKDNLIQKIKKIFK